MRGALVHMITDAIDSWASVSRVAVCSGTRVGRPGHAMQSRARPVLRVRLLRTRHVLLEGTPEEWTRCRRSDTHGGGGVDAVHHFNSLEPRVRRTVVAEACGAEWRGGLHESPQRGRGEAPWRPARSACHLG